MVLRFLKDATIKKGTRVLVRADFDVVFKGNKIEDDFRIREVLPTLRLVVEKGGLVRLLAHLGRPQGRTVRSLGLAKVARHLAGILGRKVVFVRDPFDPKLFAKYEGSQEVVLFENLRFWPGEEINDQNFARDLGKWGDVYLNDAFANSHRKHASVWTLAKILPSFAGLALEKEVVFLDKILYNPHRPFFAILGGAKLETKMPLINRFLKTADGVLLGGALASTFFIAKGLEIGKSLVDKDSKDLADINLVGKNLFLPQDVQVASGLGSLVRLVDPGDVGKNEAIFDIGPRTVKYFSFLLRSAKTVVWNGPLGLVEKNKFSYGTVGIARALQGVKALKIVGGGDTITALRKYKVLKGFSHVSSGGGAMLEFLAGKKLPGLEVLKEQY